MGDYLQTVNECIVEAQTGKAQRIYPPVSDAELRAAFYKVHMVEAIDHATFELGKPEGVPEVEPSERELWVHLGIGLTLNISLGRTMRA